jgi:GNAT superfamily N-acetyltransferase
MIIKQERLIDIVEELVPLLAEHFIEAEVLRPKLVPNPNFSLYYELEAQGAIVLVTARVDGNIVGYMLDQVYEHPHYQQLVASNDLMYILPDYRNTDVFKKMIRKIEDIAKRMGAVERLMSFKQTGNTRGGYTPYEIATQKYLGD